MLERRLVHRPAGCREEDRSGWPGPVLVVLPPASLGNLSPERFVMVDSLAQQPTGFGTDQILALTSCSWPFMAVTGILMRRWHRSVHLALGGREIRRRRSTNDNRGTVIMPSSQTILVAQGDLKTLHIVCPFLERSGYSTIAISTGRAAIETAASTTVDLALVAAVLPDLDGLTVCRGIRGTSTTPVMLVGGGAYASESYMLAAFDNGADDFIRKPFSPRELVSRVKAVLRRTSVVRPADRSVLQVDDLEIDRQSRSVRVRKVLVPLSPAEFAVLVKLASRPGRVLTRRQLAFRPSRRSGTAPRSVDVHIANIRQKLETLAPDYSQRIKTVHRIGYRLSLPDKDRTCLNRPPQEQGRAR